MAKYIEVKYHTYYFNRIINIYLSLIMFNYDYYSVTKPKINITLVPYVSPSHRNIKNGDNDLMTFLLERHQKFYTKGSN